MQICKSQDFFVAITIELAQSVGSVTGANTHFPVRLPSSFSDEASGRMEHFWMWRSHVALSDLFADALQVGKERRGSAVVSTLAYHAASPGSIPGQSGEN